MNAGNTFLRFNNDCHEKELTHPIIGGLMKRDLWPYMGIQKIDKR